MSMIYLVPHEDRTWSAVVSRSKPATACAAFTEEKEYPVEVFYTRKDMNGSSLLCADACSCREELLDSLNWIGQCGYSILELWDFCENSQISEDLEAIFDAAFSRRYEQEQLAAADLFEQSMSDSGLLDPAEICWGFPAWQGLKALVTRNQMGTYDYMLREDAKGKRSKLFGGTLGPETGVQSLRDAVAWVFKTYPHPSVKAPAPEKKPSLTVQISGADAQATPTAADNATGKVPPQQR